MSSLIWVHTVCLYAKTGLKSLQEYSADDINRRHFQTQVFLAFLGLSFKAGSKILFVSKPYLEPCNHSLTLSMLCKNFSRQHFEIFFLFFQENSLRHFIQIIFSETVCMNCQSLFSGKNKKNSSNCQLLKFYPAESVGYVMYSSN